MCKLVNRKNCEWGIEMSSSSPVYLVTLFSSSQVLVIAETVKCAFNFTSGYQQASYRVYLVLAKFQWNVSRFCMLLEISVQISILQNPLSFHQMSVISVWCLFFGVNKHHTETTDIWQKWPKVVKKCMSADSVCCLFIPCNKHHTENT